MRGNVVDPADLRTRRISAKITVKVLLPQLLTLREHLAGLISREALIEESVCPIVLETIEIATDTCIHILELSLDNSPLVCSSRSFLLKEILRFGYNDLRKSVHVAVLL